MATYRYLSGPWNTPYPRRRHCGRSDIYKIDGSGQFPISPRTSCPGSWSEACKLFAAPITKAVMLHWTGSGSPILVSGGYDPRRGRSEGCSRFTLEAAGHLSSALMCTGGSTRPSQNDDPASLCVGLGNRFDLNHPNTFRFVPRSRPAAIVASPMHRRRDPSCGPERIR